MDIKYDIKYDIKFNKSIRLRFFKFKSETELNWIECYQFEWEVLYFDFEIVIK